MVAAPGVGTSSEAIAKVPIRLAFGNFLFFAWFGLGVRNFPAFDDGSTIPVSLLEQIKEISDKITYPFAWQKNDLLKLDNTRFMHGRRKISPPRESLDRDLFRISQFRDSQR